MSYEFYVGQKVMCIDDGDRTLRKSGRFVPSEIVRGHIYTIRELDFRAFVSVESGAVLCTAIRLKEVKRVTLPDLPNCDDAWWGSMRFRPVESRAAELFRAIAQGVTDGKPIVADPLAPIEIEAAAWPLEFYFVYQGPLE